jgi:protein-tyrosine phosphatase
MATLRVLMVCMGNICRSPTAEGVLRALAAREALALEIDSAGTHGYHVGDPPDERAVRHARARGYDLSALRARAVRDEDFERFDLILAMDEANLARLRQRCPPSSAHKLKLLLEYAPAAAVREVPDPYYGDADGFERVLDLVEDAARGLLAELRARR